MTRKTWIVAIFIACIATIIIQIAGPVVLELGPTTVTVGE